MKWRPGQLDQRVTIQRIERTSDGAGGETTAWADLADVWANVRPATGRETQIEGRIAATSSAIFTIRRRADLLDTDRIVWGDVAYNIRSIMIGSQREAYLMIEAERGVAQG